MATHKTQSRKEPAPLPVTLQKDQPANPKESRAHAAASKEKSPEIPKNPAADRPSEEPNVYIEVVQKRLRAVKKRLTKIERNEELKAQGQVLDQDQLKSVAQKQEVVDLIHELEELVKHLTEVVLEEEKALKALKKKQAKEEARQAKIQEEQHEEKIRQFLQVLYVLNLFGEQETRDLFLSGGVDGFTLSQGELEDLDSLSIALQGTYESSTGLAEASKLYQARLFKLLSGSSEKVTEKKTYAQARDLVQKVFTSSHFDTAVAARLVEERAAAAAAEAARIAAEAAAAEAARLAAEAALREQEELQKSYEIIQLTEVPAFSPHSPEQINGQPGPALAFTHESEILGGVQPIVSFDGSSAVFVPIPQSLFNPHTAPLPFTFPSAFTAPLPSAQPQQPQQPQQPADAPQEPQEPPKEAAPAPQEVAQEDHSERAPANGNRRGNNRPNYDRNYRNRDGYQGDRQFSERDRQYPDRQYQERQYQERQYQDRQYHDRERHYQDRERQERPAHHDRQYQDRPHQDGGYQRRGANNGAPRARGRGGNSNRGRGGEAGQESASH